MKNCNRLNEGATQSAEKRETLVVGSAPRLEPLRVEELTDDLWQMVLRMSRINAAINSREQEVLTDVISHEASGSSSESLANKLGNLPELMRTLLRHPNLFARLADIGMQLLGEGSLAPRDRELAILRIGWLCQAPYEWGEHVLIAKKVGITCEDVERIPLGSDASGWSEHEQAILRAAEELHDDAMI